jgi:hypothetical protein
MMRRALRYGLFLLFDLALIGGASVVCSPGKVKLADSGSSSVEQSTEQSQSVSGIIAAFHDKSLTLTVASAISATGASQETTPKSINFVVDKNTTVDGRIRVGASADVTYREDKGNNVALNVHVAPDAHSLSLTKPAGR